jgi:hypothetical protein
MTGSGQMREGPSSIGICASGCEPVRRDDETIKWGGLHAEANEKRKAAIQVLRLCCFLKIDEPGYVRSSHPSRINRALRLSTPRSLKSRLPRSRASISPRASKLLRRSSHISTGKP